MPPGKLAAQAGHAFVEALLQAQQIDPGVYASYLASGMTKVVLAAKNEDALVRLHARVAETGVPCALITDYGHVMPPFFDGTSIVTAVGIGPLTRDEAKHITGKLALIP